MPGQPTLMESRLGNIRTTEALVNLAENVKRNKDACAKLMDSIHEVLGAIISLTTYPYSRRWQFWTMHLALGKAFSGAEAWERVNQECPQSFPIFVFLSPVKPSKTYCLLR
ncbi:hypothetical protein K438DRAFT_1783575 [Mycena galopus ATCC 62051]|nr:hypothetical protein K438DRAFT_1783575 [Mycena galopus ATCC 62051]